MSVRLQLLCALLLSLCTCKETSPVIGVLMLPPDKTFPRHSAFAATSYIKWIEQSGLRWLPISMYESAEEITAKLVQVDGVVLTGGKLNLNKNSLNVRIYRKAVATILEHAIKRNDAGDRFGVIGICLGYEAILSNVMGPNYSFISARDMNTMRPVYFTKAALADSYLTSAFSKTQLQRMNGKKLFYFHHKHAASLAGALADKTFTDNFYVLAAMNSTDHKQIITMVQHRKYPFLGMQFHPEKVQFEHYDKSRMSRTPASIIANQRISLLMRHMIGLKRTNSMTTGNLASHKFRLYYQAEYKNYDEIVVMLPNDYKPAVQKASETKVASAGV